MCIPAITAALGTAFGGATAAGATAAAATGASTLSTLGTILSVGGALYQGISGYKTAKAQAAAIGEQKATEARLTATEDLRRRNQFRTAIRKQTAELAARGVAIDSPTAIALGQSAAAELSFDSQATRSRGDATQRELTASQRIASSRATTSLLKGTFSAAGTLLNAAPDLWPELAA